MQQINLYQEMFQPKRASRLGGTLTGGFVAMLLIMAGLFWLQSRSIARLEQGYRQQQAQQEQLQADLVAASEKLANLKPSALLAQQLIQTQRQLSLRQPVLEQLIRLSQHKQTIVDGLEALAAQPLKRTWLTGVHFTNGGEDLALKGYALEAERLPELVRTLAGQPIFSQRHFGFARLEQQDSGTYSFDLSTRQGGAHE